MTLLNLLALKASRETLIFHKDVK
ncbi:hypothetical protein CCACVL1_11090, partial [Corchorus capsularis]